MGELKPDVLTGKRCPMEKQCGGGRSILVLCIALVLLPVGYLVSAGPTEWLMARGYVSYETLT
jgi:hypothetical protein